MFAKKSKIDLTTEAAKLVAEYIAAGGQVQVLNSSRNKVNTFKSKGAVFGKGAKAMSLRNVGIYLR